MLLTVTLVLLAIASTAAFFAHRRAEEHRLARERLERDQAEREAERDAQWRERAEWHERLRRADRLATFGRLAASLAHQLGTPINVVAGRAGMIAGDEAVDAGSRGNAKIIADQAKRMTEMLR